MPQHKRGAKAIPTSLVIAAFFGFALVVYLIVDSGAAEVAHAMLVIGWGLLPITLFHFVPLFFSALSWRELLPLSSRPDVISVTWIRWIRESINALLPVAGVGGDIASARLAHLRGVPGTQAAASMVVDTTVGVVTQLVFVMAGVTLLVIRSTEHDALQAAWTELIGIGVLVAAVAAFVLLQHRVCLAGSSNWLAASALRNGCRASRVTLRRSTIPSSQGTGAVFLLACQPVAPRWMGCRRGRNLVSDAVSGSALGVVDAFILESLTSGVRAAAFMVPGR